MVSRKKLLRRGAGRSADPRVEPKFRSGVHWSDFLSCGLDGILISIEEALRDVNRARRLLLSVSHGLSPQRRHGCLSGGVRGRQFAVSKKRRVGGRFPIDPALKRFSYLGVTAANRLFAPRWTSSRRLPPSLAFSTIFTNSSTFLTGFRLTA